MRKKSGKSRDVSEAELAAARAEASDRLRRHDANVSRKQRVEDLNSIERMLADLEHPIWFLLAFMALQLEPEPHNDDESLPQAIGRLKKTCVPLARDALEAARAPLLLQPGLELLTGKAQSPLGRSINEVTTEVLLERGASSYAAAKAVGGHGGRMETAERAARRAAKKIRSQAASQHEVLSKIEIPHKPVRRGPPTSHIKDELLSLLAQHVRTLERQQAVIVKNIDGNSPTKRARKKR
jgi:hypothetical protein